MFCRVQVRALGQPWQNIHFVLSDPFLCLFGLLSWWKIQTWLITRFVTEAVRFWFCICWYLIESMMQCIWTRCPGPLAEKQATTLSIFNFAHEVLFIPVCSKLIWWVCCQNALFQFHLTIEASPIWRSSRVWQLILLEFVFGWVRRIFLETLPNNMWRCRGCFIIFLFLGFWPQDSTNLYNCPAVILGESLERFVTSLVDWNLLIITLVVELGISNAFYFVKLNHLVLHIRTVFLGFTPCDGWLGEFGICVPHIYNPVEQESWLDNIMLLVTLVCKKHPKRIIMTGNILETYFTHKNF